MHLLHEEAQVEPVALALAREEPRTRDGGTVNLVVPVVVLQQGKRVVHARAGDEGRAHPVVNEPARHLHLPVPLLRRQPVDQQLPAAEGVEAGGTGRRRQDVDAEKPPGILDVGCNPRFGGAHVPIERRRRPRLQISGAHRASGAGQNERDG